jgi:hypothetical protein
VDDHRLAAHCLAPAGAMTCRGMPCHSTHGASLALDENVILCWLGGEILRGAERVFAEIGHNLLASPRTPRAAREPGYRLVVRHIFLGTNTGFAGVLGCKASGWPRL